MKKGRPKQTPTVIFYRRVKKEHYKILDEKLKQLKDKEKGKQTR